MAASRRVPIPGQRRRGGGRRLADGRQHNPDEVMKTAERAQGSEILVMMGSSSVDGGWLVVHKDRTGKREGDKLSWSVPSGGSE